MKKLIGRILLLTFIVAVVLNWTWARLPGTPPLPPGSHFAMIDGKRVHYVEKPGREPAVVMIHGLPGTWGDWNDVAAKLKGQRTIQIDRPGFAFSSEGYVPFAQQVAIVHGLAEKLKLKDPVIAGHSYGGSMSLQYAHDYPKEISGVVAVDPAVASEGIDVKRIIQARFIKIMELPVLHQIGVATISNLVRKTSISSGGNEAFDPDPRSQAWLDRALSLNAQFSDLNAAADEFLNAKDALDQLQAQLGGIDADVRIIQGDADKLVPPDTVVAASKTIPGAKLTMLAGGHMQTYTHPGQVAAAITAAAR